MAAEIPIDKVRVSAFEIPTETDIESDGTLEWDATTIVITEITSGDRIGTGFTYGPAAIGHFIEHELVGELVHKDAMNVTQHWDRCVAKTRNSGNDGLKMMAVAAVDVALWDLKARSLDLPLFELLGPRRDRVAAYGSGGFCNYDESQLVRQLETWVGEGLRAVKIKVGRNPSEDMARVQVSRKVIGDDVDLFVDANGAFDRKQAVSWAHTYADQHVTWFEEPVTSDDLEGLRFVRDRSPVDMEIAAGEYGYNPWYFERMIRAGAVDVIQADVTRCGGITGLLSIGEICASQYMPLSAHTSPTIHSHACCAIERARHIEHFHDHARIERLLFDGALVPKGGVLVPDVSQPGLGIELKRADAEPYLTYSSKE